jgi:ribosomal protein L13E
MSEKAAKKARARRTGARKASKKAEPKPEAEEAPPVSEKARATQGPAPRPTVLARYEREMHERPARGYSRGELESAGIAFLAAKKLGLTLDIRRRSALEANIGRLKGWYVPPQAAPKKEAPEKLEKPKKKAAQRVRKAKPKKE